MKPWEKHPITSDNLAVEKGRPKTFDKQTAAQDMNSEIKYKGWERQRDIPKASLFLRRLSPQQSIPRAEEIHTAENFANDYNKTMWNLLEKQEI